MGKEWKILNDGTILWYGKVWFTPEDGFAATFEITGAPSPPSPPPAPPNGLTPPPQRNHMIHHS